MLHWRHLHEIMLKGLRQIFDSQAQLFLNQLLLTSARALYERCSCFKQYFPTVFQLPLFNVKINKYLSSQKFQSKRYCTRKSPSQSRKTAQVLGEWFSCEGNVQVVLFKAIMSILGAHKISQKSPTGARAGFFRWQLLYTHFVGI